MTDQANGNKSVEAAATLTHCCQFDCPMCAAIDAMGIGFILMDNAGRVSWLNRAAAEQLGVPKAEAAGQSLARVLKDPQFAAFWHTIIDARDEAVGEVSVRWPQPAELKVNATLCMDGAGKRVGRALLFCDVTNEKMVRVQLSQEVTRRFLEQVGHSQDEREPLEALTAHELRVLTLVGRGDNNKRIAEVMGIAVSTVRSHLKHIYQKLSLAGRSEAISYAIRNNLAQ